jgi:hypothetical protein
MIYLKSHSFVTAAILTNKARLTFIENFLIPIKYWYYSYFINEETNGLTE